MIAFQARFSLETWSTMTQILLIYHLLPPFTNIRCFSFFLNRMCIDTFQYVHSLISVRMQSILKYPRHLTFVNGEYLIKVESKCEMVQVSRRYQAQQVSPGKGNRSHHLYFGQNYILENSTYFINLFLLVTLGTLLICPLRTI